MTDGTLKQVKRALLPERGVVALGGRDAAKFLQGLITNDIDSLEAPPRALYAALLSPQGKILFDFITVRVGEDFLLDVARARSPELVKRLTMYKLRAEVTIRDVSEQWTIAATWGRAHLPEAPASGAVTFKDPRFDGLGYRTLIPAGAAAASVPSATAAQYHAHRIACGVPESGLDFELGETFPHEAMLDQLHGVSFEKGCYVGQEIVARMEHRGTARTRTVPVVASAALPAGRPDIRAGDVSIGRLGSVNGARGLAMVRLDRAAEFALKSIPLSAGGIPLKIEFPSWAHLKPPSEPQP